MCALRDQHGDEFDDHLPASAPEWFTRAIATPSVDGFVDVDGCPVHFVRWGDPGRAGVLLVHGGAAHARWWAHIAPFLASDHTVVALDLSGHGDSGRRTAYSSALWADEVVAVTEASGIHDAPLVVGHSMGGWVGITLAATRPDRLAGLVVLDSGIVRPAPEEQAALRKSAFGPLKTYPTDDEALAHFHTVPQQPTSLAYVIDHVARQSLRAVPGGYTWKFDPSVFPRAVSDTATLESVQCRVALFRAEFGLLTAADGDVMRDLLGHRAPVVEIPLAWHHMMLDQPIALVTALRTLLADWENSEAHPRRDA